MEIRVMLRGRKEGWIGSLQEDCQKALGSSTGWKLVRALLHGCGIPHPLHWTYLAACTWEQKSPVV